jgi:hypothetical protein
VVFVAIIFALSCAPAMAQPPEGNAAVVSGRAHVWRDAFGTYVRVDSPDQYLPVAGFVPFFYEHMFPNISELEGRQVAIAGVMDWSGRPLIPMTDPDQLAVSG